MTRNPEDQFAAALAHQLKGPVSSMQAACTNMKRNLRGLLEDLATLADPGSAPGAMAGFIARVIEDPVPSPMTDLLPQDRLAVMTRHLREGGVTGDLHALASTLLRGGWDTYIADIVPLLAREPATAIEILESAARMRSNIGVAEESIARVKGLASTLRLLGLPGSGPAVDLRRGIETAAAAAAESAHAGVVIGTRLDRIPPAAGSAELLGELWANLIRNAVWAVGESGTVTIEGEGRGRGSAAHSVVRIIDDGPGIPEAVLPRLFEPLFTTRAPDGGAGLGLAIARRIVESVGGTIEVDSRPGRTCFEVCLPAAALATQSRR